VGAAVSGPRRLGPPGRAWHPPASVLDLLFTYGTLMRGFPLHALMVERAEWVGEGSVAGRLIDLGRYPGALPDDRGVIHGEVYRLRAAEHWTALDSAEGPQYHRSRIPVRMTSGRPVEAYMYWYRGPLDRGRPIPGGDYRAHAPARSIHRHATL
jgi:gamma-glutamylcyclotransferase (GGCT)/AIG2-like uncharacterized protein YtfP